MAFLSPSILLAPGRMSSQFSKQTVPWLASGIDDPLNVRGLTPEDHSILESYLGSIVDAVQGRMGHEINPKHRDELLRQLNLFRREVAKEASNSLPRKPTVLDLAWPDPFFKILGRTQELDAANIAPSESECLIAIQPGRSQQLYDGVILVDEKIADTLGKDLSAVRVWKHYTLQDAGSAATLEQIKADAYKEGYLVLVKGDLFTDRLVRLDEGAEIPANPSTLKHNLMPVTPLALLLQHWADDARLSQTGDEIKFSLQVELVQSGTRHRVSQAFATSDVETLPPPSDLAIWPNFTSADWPWTFLRFQYNKRSDLMTRFAASADFVAALCESADPKAKLKQIRDWAAQNLAVDQALKSEEMSSLVDGNGRLILERFRFRDDKKLVGEQHRLPHGADAIFFAMRDEKQNRDVPVGCVRIDQNEAPQKVDPAVVAFDFGTTNTIAFSSIGTGPAKRISFQDRVVLPIKTEDGKSQVAATYTDFFPVNDHETPVPTIAKKREFGGGALPADIRDALNHGTDHFGLSHMVFFMPRGGVTDSPEFMLSQINGGLLEFDIKWGETKDIRALVQTFLKQLMIMVAAELRSQGILAGNINWRFSYPQAFSTEHRRAFQNIIRSAWERLAQDNDEIGDVGDKISFSTEAEAAMKYFTLDPQQQRLGVGRLVIMLDIGGGTSDIAIWKDQHLLWRGSARLAGTHFFNTYLAANLDILEAIDRDAVKAFRKSLDHGDITDGAYRSRQLVELIIARRDFAERFDQAYPLHSGEPAWAGMRHVAKTALGGLHHYLGLVLGELKEREVIDDRDIAELTIALGGRGSTIFRRFVSDGDTQDLQEVAKIIGMTRDDIASPRSIEPRFSKLPKEEVARGLLFEHDATALPSNTANFEPSGLEFHAELHGDPLHFGANHDIGDLKHGTAIKDIELGELKRFLENLSKSCGLFIDINENDAESAIQLRTRTHLNSQLSKLRPEEERSAQGQDLEAPFITALRFLVETMSQSLEARDKSLAIRERK